MTSRQQLITILRDLDARNKDAFIELSEKFNGVTGGLWLSAEESIKMNGLDVFNYYVGYGETNLYDAGVLVAMRQLLAYHGWFAEYYDAGTVFLWKE
jgi:hypothetical protein